MHFAFTDAMCDPAHYLPLAKAADTLGYHTFPIGDSICYPEQADGEYPYLNDGGREFLDGAPFIDPFQLAAALSTVTTRIRFRTGVLKLPIREPVLVAKQVASLAVWSGNRFELGVGGRGHSLAVVENVEFASRALERVRLHVPFHETSSNRLHDPTCQD